jgi:hypothetical protein
MARVVWREKEPGCRAGEEAADAARAAALENCTGPCPRPNWAGCGTSREIAVMMSCLGLAGNHDPGKSWVGVGCGGPSLVRCASRVAELFVLALGLKCRGSYGKPERLTQA